MSLTVKHAKALLKESKSIMKNDHDLGSSGTARLHERFVNLEATTPAEYKTHAVRLKIYCGVHLTPFGNAFVAITKRGICQFSFIDDKNDTRQIVELKEKWSLATICESNKQTKFVVNAIFSKQQQPLSVYVQGTHFQINVWKALLEIPYGDLMTYGQLAHIMGNPKAARAVGSAVALNPVAFLIPCHRVIRSSGVIGEYRWGSARKRSILSWEILNAPAL